MTGRSPDRVDVKSASAMPPYACRDRLSDVTAPFSRPSRRRTCMALDAIRGYDRKPQISNPNYNCRPIAGARASPPRGPKH